MIQENELLRRTFKDFGTEAHSFVVEIKAKLVLSPQLERDIPKTIPRY